MTTTADIVERKKQIREQAHANRNAQPNKDELSAAICEKFMALPAYAQLSYSDTGCSRMALGQFREYAHLHLSMKKHQ